MSRHQTEGMADNERSRHSATWYVRHESGEPPSPVECREWEEWCADPDNAAEYDQFIRLGAEMRRSPRPALPTDEEIRENRRMIRPALLTSTWAKGFRPVRTLTRVAIAGAVLMALIVAMTTFNRPWSKPTIPRVETDKPSGAAPFSELTLETLRAAGRPVFVNLEAQWCSACLVNERNALSRESVRQTMARKQVAYLKGEWSSQDVALIAFVQRYGRGGVPLYLLFCPGRNEPEVLPQNLTEDIMLNVLSKVPDQTRPST